MNWPADQGTLRIHRILVFLRLGLAPVLIFLLTLQNRCAPALIGTLIGLLLAIAIVPLLVYLFRREWLARPAAARTLVLFDFLATSLITVIASRNEVLPVFFPLYALLVSVEAACWWGWAGALIPAALGGAILNWLYMDVEMPSAGHSLVIAALNLAWSIVLGYFVQWALGLWRERQRMTEWLRQQEGIVRHISEQLHGWQDTALILQRAGSLHELLETALREAEKATHSPLSMAVLRDRQGGNLHTECWRGFALSDAGRTILQPGERLPAHRGTGWVEVGHVLTVPLRPTLAPVSDYDVGDLGRLVIARPEPYHPHEEQWFNMLATFTAALVENRFLRGQLGRIQEEADSVLLAGRALVSLPNPAAAMELACRNVLNALKLRQVVLFLYAQESEPGCRMVIYPEKGPAQTATMPLQGRGVRLLRRFLDVGTAVIFNRRSEWPELFDLMAWKEFQAVASFPLYVLGRSWGALCLLADVPDAFPPQTQQNLAIFSGEIAMALENYYLRQAISKVRV